MRSRRWVASLVLAAGLGAAVAGCTALLGLDGDTIVQSGDASADVQPMADGGAPDTTTSDAAMAMDAKTHDAAAATDGGSSEAGPCPTIYVWGTGGRDSNDGCSPAQALATIGQALRNAAPGQTIEVCASNGQVYDENSLTVGVPVSLLGGFTCSTTTFDPRDAGKTVVTNSLGTGPAATLTLSSFDGGTIVLDGGVALPVVDGFQISGPASAGPNGTSIAVQALGGATGTISNCDLKALGALNSYGVSIGAASVTVTGNTITSADAGLSYGVVVDPGTAGVASPNISHNTISCGIGTGGVTRTTAVVIRANQGGAVQMNGEPADGGPGLFGNTIESVGGLPTVGVDVEGNVAIDVSGNTIEQTGSGPTDGGAAPSTPTSVTGIRIFENSGEAVIRSNRIYAGGLNGPGQKYTNWVGNYHGIDVRQTEPDAGGSGQVIIVNNLIYGGPYAHAPQPAGAPAAIYLDPANDPIIVYNTIFTGYLGTGTGAAIWVNTGTGAVIENNVLAGTGAGIGGIQINAGSSVANVENNLFLSEPYLLLPGATTTDVTGMQQALAMLGATASGNLVMTAACSGEDLDAGSCVTQPACDGGDVNACMATLIAGWTASDQGYGLLFGTAGWGLAKGVSCSIAQGGLDLADAGIYSVDRLGNPRGSSPSVGAQQLDGGCE